jgi:hypothetical protein
MNRRTRVAAVFAAVGLLSMAASTAIAAAPTYSISVSKTASPTAVPPSGGTVTFTVWVTGTGTGFFQSLHFVESMGGCTLAYSSGDSNTNAKLDQGETWAYTCSVDNVMPNDSNNVTVNACHALGTPCTSSPDATGTGQVTLGTGAATEAPPTEAPPTEAPPTEAPPTQAPPTGVPPSTNPSSNVGDITAAPTDTVDLGGAPRSTDLKSMLQLIAVLCFLVASVVVMTPASAKAASKANRPS